MVACASAMRPLSSSSSQAPSGPRHCRVEAPAPCRGKPSPSPSASVVRTRWPGDQRRVVAWIQDVGALRVNRCLVQPAGREKCRGEEILGEVVAVRHLTACSNDVAELRRTPAGSRCVRCRRRTGRPPCKPPRPARIANSARGRSPAAPTRRRAAAGRCNGPPSPETHPGSIR